MFWSPFLQKILFFTFFKLALKNGRKAVEAMRGRSGKGRVLEQVPLNTLITKM
jgi:hypothetical protein